MVKSPSSSTPLTVFSLADDLADRALLPDADNSNLTSPPPASALLANVPETENSGSPSLPPFVSQLTKTNPIIATKAIIPKNLILFFIKNSLSNIKKPL
jgi:hypothetical protein